MEISGLMAGLISTGIIWLILMIISVIAISRRTDLDKNQRQKWMILVAILPFLGLLIYVVTNFSKAKKLLWLGVAGAVLSVSATVFFVYNRKHEDVSQKEGVKMTAQQLFDAFKTDENAANALYLDKAIELSGEVLAVTTNQDGQVVVDIKTNDPFVVINCTFKTDPGTLTEGQNITFKGFCRGYIPDANVVINDGILVK
jgi:Ca2+/Na+ antiporter